MEQSAIMERRTWNTMDKTGWGDGPWTSEPDKEQWPDEATGYACLIKRNVLGALCGYVGVPEGHPWHGSGWWADRDTDAEMTPALILLDSVQVHGGLNYTAACEEGPDDRTICHIPAAGEPERLWWLGFDCGHINRDFVPVADLKLRRSGIPLPSILTVPASAYRTVAYVKAECARLAATAAEAAALSRIPPE